jgi:hypothetical protein
MGWQSIHWLEGTFTGFEDLGQHHGWPGVIHLNVPISIPYQRFEREIRALGYP